VYNKLSSWHYNNNLQDKATQWHSDWTTAKALRRNRNGSVVFALPTIGKVTRKVVWLKVGTRVQRNEYIITPKGTSCFVDYYPTTPLPQYNHNWEDAHYASVGR
jgi:hypothetical protein